MNIRTSQQVNELDCCPCPVPECTPRKDCESKTSSPTLGPWGPVAPPTGSTSDKVTRIFTTKEYLAGITYSGTAQRHVNAEFSATDTREEFLEEVYLNWYSGLGADPPNYTWNEYQYTSWIDDECGDYGFTYAGDPNKDPRDATYEYGDEEEICTESEHSISTTGTSTSGTPLALQGCPGPFTPDGASYYWNFTSTDAVGVRLSDGFNETEFLEAGIAAINPSWPGTDPGTACVALTVSDWPTVADVLASVDGGVWPPCEDNNPPNASASADLLTVRYRFGAPAGYTGTIWEMEWDEVKAPNAWWEWFDDGAVGAEPSPGPELVAHRSWDWGGDTGNLFSGWFEMDPPAYAGQTRTANVLTVCYRSERLGVKPTAWGDQITLPEP